MKFRPVMKEECNHGAPTNRRHTAQKHNKFSRFRHPLSSHIYVPHPEKIPYPMIPKYSMRTTHLRRISSHGKLRRTPCLAPIPAARTGARTNAPRPSRQAHDRCTTAMGTPITTLVLYLQNRQYTPLSQTFNTKRRWRMHGSVGKRRLVTGPPGQKATGHPPGEATLSADILDLAVQIKGSSGCSVGRNPPRGSNPPPRDGRCVL